MELSAEALQALQSHLQDQGAGVSATELLEAQQTGGGRALRQLVAETTHEDAEDSEEDAEEMRMPWVEGGRSLAPPCGTDRDDLAKILQVLAARPGDVMYDLGCGDGRVCLACARAGATRCVGVEIEEALLSRFQEAIGRGEKSGDLATGQVVARSEDLRDCDFSDATLIYVFLLPAALEVLEEKLEDAVKRGARLVCNTWGPRSWIPLETLQLNELGTLTLLVYGEESFKYEGPSDNLAK